MKRFVRRMMSKKEEIPKTLLEVFIASASLVIGAVVAIISYNVQFSTYETIVVTMLSFLCAEYISHSFIEKSKYFTAKREYSLLEHLNKWTGKLYEMNDYCKTILDNSHGERDLFVVNCDRSIDKLYYTLRTAAVDKKVEISSDYIVNSVGVFEALNMTNEKVVELTFPIDSVENGLLKTPEDKKFFETAYKMVEVGLVEKIRVLLLLGENIDLSDKRLVALFDFYNNTNGFAGKYIKEEDFKNACESNMISSTQLDFGIYGPKMLFRVDQYEPYKGVYTKDEDIILRYHKLFDEVWNFESITHDLPGTVIPTGSKPKAITLSELFVSLAGV